MICHILNYVNYSMFNCVITRKAVASLIFVIYMLMQMKKKIIIYKLYINTDEPHCPTLLSVSVIMV